MSIDHKPISDVALDLARRFLMGCGVVHLWNKALERKR